MPQMPKPPIKTLAPAGISATAAVALLKIFDIFPKNGQMSPEGVLPGARPHQGIKFVRPTPAHDYHNRNFSWREIGGVPTQAAESRPGRQKTGEDFHPLNDQPDSAQLGLAVMQLAAGGPDKHQVGRDVPFSGQFLNEVGAESSFDNLEINVDVRIGFVKEF
jgi:hypothetical protein